VGHAHPGATENAGLENAVPSKMLGWKMQDWKIRHESAEVEYAGLENARPKCRGGKCGPTTYGKPNNTRHIFTALTHNGTAYWSCLFYNFLVTIVLL